MNRAELSEMEEKIMDEFAKRRSLGGFDANASTILLMLRWIYELTRHEIEKAPKEKDPTPDIDGARVALRPKKK